jgi:N-methylhydantoinase B
MICMPDPILVEIVRNYLNAATKEMAWAFDRTAFDPTITELKDYSLGLFDDEFNIVAESVGIPPFSGTLGMGIETAVKAIGLDNLREGDVFCNNWPYWNAGQVNDATVAAPIFFKNEIIGYSAAKAHLIDLGQKDPNYCIDTTDVYQEGLKLPAVRLFKSGKIDLEIERILKFNSRIPDRNMGNILGQVSAVQTGVKRFASLAETYGLSIFRECLASILRDGKRLARVRLKHLPKGSWSAEDYLDNNVLTDRPVNMKVTVTINNEEFIVDFTGSSKQVEGTVNCPLGITISVANSVFKSITTPMEPTNAGQFSPVRVIAPAGTIFNAVPPAGVFLVWPAGHAYDLLRKALIQGMPHCIPACSTGDSYALLMSGGSSEKYPYKHFYIFVNDHGGGLGAYDGSDGENAVSHDAISGAQNNPTEVNERMCPVIVERWALVTDSGGAGKFRGGLGIVEDVRVLSRTRATTLFLRRKSPPWGFRGGRAAPAGKIIFFPGTKKERVVSSTTIDMKEGDRLRVISAGGGGWGDPLQRDPNLVAEDVKLGYVTLRAARSVYGVALHKKTLKVLRPETSILRRTMRRKSRRRV